jgi:hypothetical protein
MSVYNIHQSGVPADAVNIMRPSKWGNPFKIGVDGTRTEVIEKFREYVFANPELLEQIRTELVGKDLICCCKPKACHGDILIEITNSGNLF